MPTTLTNGIQLPDKGSVDWYGSMQSNYNLIDTHLGNTDIHVTAEDKANWDSKQGSLSQAQLDAIAQVATNTNDIATLQSGKANASHTHSSSDITDIGDYATKQYVDNSISGLVDNAPDALNTLNELSAALNDDSNFASTVATALGAKANSADLATVATSGSYNDLSNKPTINDSTITIQKNGSLVDTFTTNGSAKTIDIPVPTKTSDLTNDSNFVDTSNSAVASGITSAKVTSYDSHIADTDIHVTTADKTKWNNGVSQSYVLRYSSSSVTDNSTIAYSTLDNTDNIKASDKIIDSDGKIFSIVSVDTTNQTVTVGSALIDLAKDNDVVHTSGHEAISGDKVFNNRLIKNIDVVLGTAPSTGKFSNIEIADNSKSSLLQIMCGVYDTGQTYARFFIQNKMADDGTGLSPTGTMRACGFNINLPASSTSEGQGSITPRANKTTDFGLANYQWKNVWCEKLYLNGTELAPSAFVTTDTAQTISGNKTFSSDLTVANTDTTANTPNLSLRNYKADRGTTDTAVQAISFLDKNAKALTTIESRRISNGNTATNILCYNTDDSNNTVSGGVAIIKSKTDTHFAPNADNAVTCGRSLAKWSDVQTYKVNGVEPSSLSLPTDNASNIIDISSYMTVLDGSSANTYQAPGNGYISITMNNCSGVQAYITGFWGHQVVRPSIGGIRFFMPICKNMTANILIFGGIIDNARFIPCQGNV